MVMSFWGMALTAESLTGYEPRHVHAQEERRAAYKKAEAEQEAKECTFHPTLDIHSTHLVAQRNKAAKVWLPSQAALMPLQAEMGTSET